ncbi:MAG: hypothetical protein JW808_01400, partial [Victivallales bacterium]|nr:hypothetical protein [Victivallales bacterium]
MDSRLLEWQKDILAELLLCVTYSRRYATLSPDGGATVPVGQINAEAADFAVECAFVNAKFLG